MCTVITQWQSETLKNKDNIIKDTMLHNIINSKTSKTLVFPVLYGIIYYRNILYAIQMYFRSSQIMVFIIQRVKYFSMLPMNYQQLFDLKLLIYLYNIMCINIYYMLYDVERFCCRPK